MNNSFLDNTIDENLKFFAQIGGKNIHVKKVRSDVGLKAEGDEPILVSQLSADQKMMLNTAIVLLSNPEIIIMDEPTTGIFGSLNNLNW
jgi:ABC-type multidrug transport system ATPase subunit